MAYELYALIGVTLILFIAIFAQQIAIDRVYGAKYALSNRESVPGDQSELVNRLTRIVRNHVEGIAVFAPLVLIAAVSEISNPFTRYSSLAIVILRLLHFLFYSFGVTPFRSFAWGLGFLIATPVFLYGLLSAVM